MMSAGIMDTKCYTLIFNVAYEYLEFIVLEHILQYVTALAISNVKKMN